MADKKIFSLLFVFVLFLVLAPSLSLAQSGQEALNALKKLELRVEYGIAYADYAPALTEAGFPVRLFLAGPDARSNPDIAAALTSALQHYEAVRDIWSEKYADGAVTDRITDGYLRSSYYRCVHDYHTPFLSSRNAYTGEMTYTVGIDECLSRIREKASEALAIAANALAQAGKKAAAAKVELEFTTLANIERRTAADRAELEAVKTEIEKIRADCQQLKDAHARLQQELHTVRKENELLSSRLAAPAKKKKKKK